MRKWFRKITKMLKKVKHYRRNRSMRAMLLRTLPILTPEIRAEQAETERLFAERAAKSWETGIQIARRPC
jgi:hypothetical protein